MTMSIHWILFSLVHIGLSNAIPEESKTIYSHTSTNSAPAAYANNAREDASIPDVNYDEIQDGARPVESVRALSRDTQQLPTLPVYSTGENYSSITDDDKGVTMAASGVTTVTPVGLSATEPVTPTCDGPLCEQENGHFTLNSSACSNTSRFEKIDSSGLSSIRIISNNPFGVDNPVQECQWEIEIPLTFFVGVTVDQNQSEVDGNFTLTMWQAYAKTSYDLGNLSDIVVNESRLLNSSVSFFPSWNRFSGHRITLKHRFNGKGLYSGRAVILHYIVQEGPYIQTLPLTKCTDVMGHVTVPTALQRYGYDGSFELNISNNDSVLISFTRFFVPTPWDGMNYCPYSYLQLTNVLDETNQTMCGNGKDQGKQLYVFQSSIHLRFHAEGSMVGVDFKMVYLVVPRTEEPQLLADNLVNCSVPHYPRFEALLKCNTLTECMSGEDERNCSYHSPACGPDALDAGSKCLKTKGLAGDATWYESKQKCSLEKGNSLPTFRTKEEFDTFKTLMDSIRGIREVYIGAHMLDRWQVAQVAHLYKYIWQWTDGTTAFSLHVKHAINRPVCCTYNVGEQSLKHVECDQTRDVVQVCEFEKPNLNVPVQKKIQTHKEGSTPVTDSSDVWSVSVVHCPAKHTTRDFLSCDAQARCNAAEPDMSCNAGGVTVPMFVCQQSGLPLHYTLVCDHMQHCPDNSDEVFCQYIACPLTSFDCRSQQCFNDSQRCDDNLDCYDGQDEASCMAQHYLDNINHFFSPGIIHLNGKGNFVYTSSDCPSSHFVCSGELCLPVYLRCNGVDDCPGREDEAGCNRYTCPGFYRCHGSSVCLHASNICDGAPQCPRQDDELLCHPVCPEGCLCLGLAFVCNVKLSNASLSEIRYLDASHSGMTLTDVNGSPYLIHLRLLYCDITSIPSDMNFPNLRELDLSWNLLTHLAMEHFSGLVNLRVLLLARNPLTRVSPSPSSLLRHIDLSHTSLEVYNSSLFLQGVGMVLLNMSWSLLTTIQENGFQSTPLLKHVDLRGCQLNSYPTDLLRHLTYLQTVQSDDYKLCCPPMLPAGFDQKNCRAPQNLVASCNDLLRSSTYRICLWLFASLSVVGNVGSLGARLYLHNQGDTLGSFGVFVINLSVADFFMGVYLTIVGVADRVYEGRYFWYDDAWKNSAACKTAGLLSFLSNEVGAMMICLITLDRYLVLRFPFSRIHFGRRSALVACGLVWLLGVFLAAVPLLPMTSHWEFYSQTGICIPLPFTNNGRLKGFNYSFCIMILLNLVLFLFIALGQAAIYWSIRSKSIPSSTKTKSRDAAIARRLTTVVVSDFLCWFPVGLLGLLAATGTEIPGELNVAVAIFVLPLNSALNPFLYTFNVIMEKRSKAREAVWRKRLETCVRMELTEASVR